MSKDVEDEGVEPRISPCDSECFYGILKVVTNTGKEFRNGTNGVKHEPYLLIQQKNHGIAEIRTTS